MVVAYAEKNKRFLTDDVRMSLPEDFPHPPDGRAWGSVMRMATRMNIVVRDGYAAAISSNLSPKPVWKAIIKAPVKTSSSRPKLKRT